MSLSKDSAILPCETALIAVTMANIKERTLSLIILPQVATVPTLSPKEDRRFVSNQMIALMNLIELTNRSKRRYAPEAKQLAPA
jgi:hypothetical protein